MKARSEASRDHFCSAPAGLEFPAARDRILCFFELRFSAGSPTLPLHAGFDRFPLRRARAAHARKFPNCASDLSAREQLAIRWNQLRAPTLLMTSWLAERASARRCSRYRAYAQRELLRAWPTVASWSSCPNHPSLAAWTVTTGMAPTLPFILALLLTQRRVWMELQQTTDSAFYKNSNVALPTSSPSSVSNTPVFKKSRLFSLLYLTHSRRSEESMQEKGTHR